MRIAIGSAVVMLSLSSAAAVAALAQRPPRSVWDNVYTQAQAARGKIVYDAKCGSCHGNKLQGLDIAPTLAGGRFITSWNAQTAGTLATRIRMTMPADDPGSLSSAATADTMAYMFMVNGFPQGAVELPPNKASLEQIRIEAQR
jgi:cytochrome c5